MADTILSQVLAENIKQQYVRLLGFNPLKTKRRLLYLKTQFLPRSKRFSSRL
jgi:hypothetical protein